MDALKPFRPSRQNGGAQPSRPANTLGQRYTYRGDRLTADHLRGQSCTAIMRYNGHKYVCIRAGGKMLVKFDNGERHTVLAYLLRKTKD